MFGTIDSGPSKRRLWSAFAGILGIEPAADSIGAKPEIETVYYRVADWP